MVLDSPDPARLAWFWAGLLGGEPIEWYDGWITLEPPPHGQRLSFQKSSAAQGRGVHFDVLVADLEASHERVVTAGGHYVGERWSPRPAEDGTSVRWRVYEDPDGHPFCLVVR